MRNPGFIGIEDIQKVCLPNGFSQFKIEGRSLGSAVVLEFLLYCMTKPEHQMKVREEIYLDSALDLFWRPHAACRRRGIEMNHWAIGREIGKKGRFRRAPGRGRAWI